MLRNKKFQINKITYFLLLLFLFNNSLLSQEKEIEFEITSNPDISNSWWLEKNNFGIKPNGIDFKLKWKVEKSKINYTVNVFLKEERSYLSESFIKYHFSDETFLRIGKYYRDFSNYLNDELSSGHMLISKNSQPMPKIGIVGSNNINNKISFNYGIAHGTFGRNEFYNKSPLLHEKFLYMNIHKKDYKVSIGLVHEAIWGGSTIDDGSQPDSFSDFLRVFISADRKLEDYDDNIPDTHLNALGNHIGIWDISFKKTSKNRSTKFYYQHIFEDTSGLRFRNEIDGLWGLELDNYIQDSTFLLEYLHTTHQNMNPPYVAESYYNHGVYKKGWSYKNYTLGNPFINHLEVQPVDVIHMATARKFFDYLYQIKVSRKTNISDSIKYQININKKINTTNTISLFILNNEDKIGIGANIAWIL